MMKVGTIDLLSKRSIPILAFLILIGLLGSTLIAWAQFQVGVQFVHTEAELEQLRDNCTFFGFLSALIIIPVLVCCIYIYQRQATFAVNTVHDRNKNILEGTNAGTWDWNIKTNELVLNERWAEIIGYSLEELEPISIQTWEQTVHPEDLKLAEVALKEHFAGELNYYDVQFRQKHKSGHWIWVNARGRVIEWSEDGQPVQMSGTHMDITFQKRIEEQREAAHNLIKGVFDASLKVSIIATDVKGIITVFNTGAERMLGYSAAEMIGHKTPLHFHDAEEISERAKHLSLDPDIIPQNFQVFTAQVTDEGHFEDEWTYIHQSGKRLKVNLTVTAIRDEKNQVTGYLGIATDITLRKKAEKALQESQLMLQNVLNNIPARVFWKDRESVYLGGNLRFAEDAGLENTKQLEGKTDLDLIWTEQAEAYRSDDHEVIFTEEPKIDYEEQQTRPDGSITWLKTSKIPLRNQRDDVIGVLGTYEDITKRKEAEEALISAKNEAVEANKAKDDFLAVMSHEMRTPLNPILGFADILRQSIKTEPERDYLETIISSAQRQLTLIDDILEFMRLNRGNVRSNPEPFNLVDLCLTALNDASSTAKQLQLRFENGIGGVKVSDKLVVQTDLLMLRRVLDNLLNNACKYTETGSIVLSVAKKQDTVNTFIFSVIDTGIGIAPEMCEHLFEAFSQVDSSYSRNHEGVGLGLAICKKLLDSLNGSISLESSLDSGSTFRVELPLELIRETNRDKDPREKTNECIFEKPLEILIADDKDDNLLIARSLIKKFGGIVTEVSNGEEAVCVCNDQQFDVILMDLAMPTMNGFEAVEAIRASKNLNNSTPVIAVSADVSRQAQNRCKEIGMQDYVSKPIDPAKLFTAIKRHC